MIKQGGKVPPLPNDKGYYSEFSDYSELSDYSEFPPKRKKLKKNMQNIRLFKIKALPLHRI